MRQSLLVLSKYSDGISDLDILDKLEEKQSGVAQILQTTTNSIRIDTKST